MQEGIYDEVVLGELLFEKFTALKVVSGFEPGVVCGPLTHLNAVQKAIRHVEDACTKGAKILFRGESKPGAGPPGTSSSLRSLTI